MADVSYIHDVSYFESVELKHATEQVLEDIGAQVADVGEVIDRWTAAIETDFAWINRLKRAKTTAQGIVKYEGHLRGL